MYLEQCRQLMLQLHLSDQQIYCHLIKEILQYIFKKLQFIFWKYPEAILSFWCGSQIYQEKYVNTIAADALAPCVARLSAAMVLTIKDLCLHQKGFQLPTSSVSKTFKKSWIILFMGQGVWLNHPLYSTYNRKGGIFFFIKSYLDFGWKYPYLVKQYKQNFHT